MKNLNKLFLRSMILACALCGFFTLSAQKAGETVKDADGNEYKTVVIGSQTWFAENLKTTKYANGNAIKNVTDKATWVSCKSPAYCWYDNNASNKDEYGALYNWYVINSGNICPNGWHVATDADWTTLTNKVGGEKKAGAALKEKGTKHWETTSNDVKDDYNFGIVGAGFRDPYGNFTWQNVDGCFWSATGKTPSYAWYRHTFHYDNALSRHEVQKCNGYSVRCVKNN